MRVDHSASLCAPNVGAEPTTPGDSWIGEINANDVYVRSGDSQNHYTVCKLSAGNRVTVVSERGEWLEILPPAGTFSLISGDYVDRVDDHSGVVNGTNVRVRAGSLISDDKYTVQAMLGKGDKVTIVGSNPDGFLRIEPPTGATLWVSRSFVSKPGMENEPTTAGRPGGSASPENQADSISHQIAVRCRVTAFPPNPLRKMGVRRAGGNRPQLP